MLSLAPVAELPALGLCSYSQGVSPSATIETEEFSQKQGRSSLLQALAVNLRENQAMSPELLAVNAVSDRIARCPRLTPEISTGDKTPITDGHIDFYSSKAKSNRTHLGRVAVQVKGRTTNKKVKASRKTVSFSVGKEVLQFFRKHGGGLYFYVPMNEEGMQREVFYANLLPFKIDRILDNAPKRQQTFSVKFERLPDDPTSIENIVRLAWEGRNQTSTTNKVDYFLSQAEGITIHSLVGIDESRPTRLSLEETDYVLLAHLPGGLSIPLDLDIEVLPNQYLERDLAVPISCGGIVFDRATGRRVDEETHLIRLSAGIELRIKEGEKGLRTNLHLTREGSLREQAKNFDFLLAAAAGEAMMIGKSVNTPQAGDPELFKELQEARVELSKLIELFDELGLTDEQSSGFQLNQSMRQTLLALHQGLVQDKPIQGHSDGTGKFDVVVGGHKIMIVVLPAEEPGFCRIIDPFDPSKRDRFQIYARNEDGSTELIDWGTVYEAVTSEEMATVLNLRLENIVAAYEALEDRPDAISKANYAVLRILTAADLTKDESHRANLLEGAECLCKWLLKEDPDTLIFKINWWQTLYRRGGLTGTYRRDIREARRHLDRTDNLAGLLEACTVILLKDTEELELVLSELSEEERAWLQEWPIWTLAEEAREPKMPLVETIPSSNGKISPGGTPELA